MPLFDTSSTPSAVFGESATFKDKPLKEKNPLREAFVVNELSHLDSKTLKEFAYSPEAKYMLENEIISYDALDNLCKRNFEDKEAEMVICHMAKENEDETWNALLRCRMEERRLMNELIAKYGEDARPYAKKCHDEYVNKCVPKHFRSDCKDGNCEPPHGMPGHHDHGGPFGH